MDADLSHPPSLLPIMVSRMNGFDCVIGTRYAQGSRIEQWPTHRRLISAVATAIATKLAKTTCTDPLSGFFLLRKSSLRGVVLSGAGSKPLFEILSQRELTLFEVPYVFANRRHGKSKLDPVRVLAYARLAGSLWLDSRRESWPVGEDRESGAPQTR